MGQRAVRALGLMQKLTRPYSANTRNHPPRLPGNNNRPTLLSSWGIKIMRPGERLPELG